MAPNVDPDTSAPETRARPAVQHDIVVVGASAGGVEALERLVEGFPPEVGAAIFIVLHVMPGGTSVLARILQRHTQLPCRTAEDAEPIECGRIYVAPPDHHMVVHAGKVALTQEPRVNGHRPAIDALFGSAARAFGPHVIGVILSGALDDGSVGLRMIVDAGGRALVQDTGEAPYASMPRSALDLVPSAQQLPLARMAARICEMIDGPTAEPVPEMIDAPTAEPVPEMTDRPTTAAHPEPETPPAVPRPTSRSGQASEGRSG